METLDQGWTYDATCKCGEKRTISENVHQNPIWVCHGCKGVNNIVTDPSCVKYKKGDVKKKAELQKMYGDKFPKQETEEVS